MTVERYHCHLIAANGSEHVELARVLLRIGVETTDPSSVSPAGESSSRAIKALMRKADFVCASVGAGNAESILFELGISVGLGRPTFVILNPEATIPFSVQSIPYVRAKTNNAEAIHFHLGAFLQNLRTSRPYRVPSRAPVQLKPLHWADDIASRTSNLSEQEVENQLRRAFEEAGADTVSQSYVSDNGRTLRPDILAWFRGAPESLGNPIVIEVSNSRNIGRGALVDRTNEYLKAATARTAILVTNRIADDIEIVPTSNGYIFIMSSEELFKLLGRGSLLQDLVQRRNRFAHGLPL